MTISRTDPFTNQAWVSGNNLYTAIAKDVYGRRSTNSVNVAITNSVFVYDLNGNLLSDGTRGFAYDDENQLTSVYVTNVWRDDFVYDGKMCRRIERDYSWNGGSWLQTNEVHFIYDGNLVVQERNANNLPSVTYTRGNDLSGSLQGAGGIGGLLARTDNGQMIAGSIFAHSPYHADANGNVTCLIYTNQMIAARYLYDPYGNTLAQYGSLANANDYRFSSKEWNANSGLYYYLYRFYDPNFQRWINRDPIGDFGNLLYFPANKYRHFDRIFGVIQRKDGINLNEMVQNNPMTLVDGFGLESSMCASLRDQIQATIRNLNSGVNGTLNPQAEIELMNLENLWSLYNCDDDDDGGNSPPLLPPLPCPTAPVKKPMPTPIFFIPTPTPELPPIRIPPFRIPPFRLPPFEPIPIE